MTPPNSEEKKPSEREQKTSRPAASQKKPEEEPEKAEDKAAQPSKKPSEAKPAEPGKKPGSRVIEPAKKPSLVPEDRKAKESEPTKKPEAKTPMPSEEPKDRPSVPSKEAKPPTSAEKPAGSSPSLELPADTLAFPKRQLDRKSLANKSKEELIDIVLQLGTDLLRSTDRVDVEVKAPVPTFKVDIKVDKFVRLPATPSRRSLAQTAPIWRVVLVSSDPQHPPIGLELAGNIVIGRIVGEQEPDLDLTPYDAARLGVSRQHAALHPTKSSLILIDLRSTNGTFHNSVKVTSGAGRELKDGDVISFGLLHFKLHVVGERRLSAE